MLRLNQQTKGVNASQAGKMLSTLIEKVAEQSVPIIGAVTGATVNTMFTDFYQDMARGHFIINRLENKYGKQEIELA